jgi:hypothetical protein
MKKLPADSLVFLFDNWKWFLENSTQLCAAPDYGRHTRTVGYTYRTKTHSLLSTLVITHQNVIENINDILGNPVVKVTILFQLSEAGLKRHPDKGYLYSEEFIVFRYDLSGCFDTSKPMIDVIGALNDGGTYAIPMNHPSPEYLHKTTDVFEMKWSEDVLVDFIMNQKLTKN